MKTALIGSIIVKSYTDAYTQIQTVSQKADGIELRLDFLSAMDHQQIGELRQACALPVIFTLRTTAQGGKWDGSPAEYEQTLFALCAHQPDFLDVEYDVSETLLQNIHAHFPKIKLMCSVHDFQETPADLEKLFLNLQKPYFYAYKIACLARSSLDALRILHFTQTISKQYRITVIGMGEEGQCTRILAPQVGSLFAYAGVDKGMEVAPGQLTLNELLTRYHFRSLDRHTTVYALLGDPINLSVGHILHNQAISLLGKNAVYVKIRCTSAQLPAVWSLLQPLKWAGLSITMPLKEDFFKLLVKTKKADVPQFASLLAGYAKLTSKCISQFAGHRLRVSCQQLLGIKAVNTLNFADDTYHGFNTDGQGAMSALSQYMEVSQQTILILGAGGAARAIAYTALQQQARVIILNRNFVKADGLAKELGCEAYPLTKLFALKNQYTVIINTLPKKAYDDVQWRTDVSLNPAAIAMDIVYQPIETLFLKWAKTSGCRFIYGYEMFVFQALAQIQIWFSPNYTQIERIKNLMLEYFTLSARMVDPIT